MNPEFPSIKPVRPEPQTSGRVPPVAVVAPLGFVAPSELLVLKYRSPSRAHGTEVA